MTAAYWTPERVDLLRRLWSEGRSASAVAGIMPGATRNAVLGKVHRLGLVQGQACLRADRLPAARPSPASRSARAPGPAIPAGPEAPASGRASATRCRMATTEAPVATVSTVRTAGPTSDVTRAPGVGPLIALAQLTRTTCRFPVGEPDRPGFGFCGGLRTRGAYCAGHAAVAYRGGSLSGEALVRWATGLGRAARNG